ncbi:uncharacterized protein LOC126605980 [Malus sylvestris]|uniref:uncharacterized protein n=1 Tax=Malus domestica TaxID=3750 RepID=UPI0010AA0E6C|nr:uncharacterized protein LOC114821702 isoform X1 [Malus domestica]XP_050129401.1 uncharacterized protein LOC126605980 [Malus sylvestris]
MKKPKSGSCLLSKTQSYSTKLMNFFNLPIPPPPFSSLLSPDSYTLHSLFLSRKTRRCTSSSSSFSFLFVGLSATPPSPSRVLCGNQRPSLISLIRRRDESELSVDSLRCRRAPFFWLYAESDCHFDDPKDFYEKIDSSDDNDDEEN